MENQFVIRLKKIQDELLNLKTIGKYTSTIPFNFTSVDITSSGLYRITYNDNDENILSFITNALPVPLFESVKARSINGNIQDVEIYIDPDLLSSVLQLTILSTNEVIGFEKIS